VFEGVKLMSVHAILKIKAFLWNK